MLGTSERGNIVARCDDVSHTHVIESYSCASFFIFINQNLKIKTKIILIYISFSQSENSVLGGLYQI